MTMDFGLSEEQVLLKDSIDGFLKTRAPLDRTRKFADGKETRATDLWQGLTELGVPGLLIGDAHGGVGLTPLDAALVAESLGAHVAPVPFVGTAVLAPLAIARAGSPAQQNDWLPKLADGRVIAGAAFTEAVGVRDGAGVVHKGDTLDGTALFVLDFEADVYVVADRTRRLWLVPADAPGLTRVKLATIDRTRPLGELRFTNVRAEVLPGSTDTGVVASLIDAGRVMLAADTVGAARAMLDQAVGYAKTREQFGRPIGSFQAVKHMCAEMAAELEPCVAMFWYAAHALAAVPEEASITACHTKALVSEMGKHVAKLATEVHGGMGFTDLLGLHYWFKRIGANRQLLGSPERLREEAARLQGLIATG
jgi:alkylation response protein AidB-like acyl-CoA dehydrogenase